MTNHAHSPRSPLTGRTTTRLISTVESVRLVDAWKQAFDIDISDELAGISRISLWRCDQTQLEFFTPSKARGSSRIYEELQKLDWYYLPQKWEFDAAIEDLSGKQSILEVGSGPGFFVELAAKRLDAPTIKGVEFNRFALHRAREKHLPVYDVSLAELASRKEAFEAVCSFQVLEHVDKPLHFLRNLITLCAMDGIIIVTVPNKESFLKHESNLLDLPPHHMTRWNELALRYLEGLLPIKLIKLRLEPLAPYHITSYLRAHSGRLCSLFPHAGKLLSGQRLEWATLLLKKSKFHRLMRGHSLLAIFRKL